MPEGDMIMWLGHLRDICAERDTGRLVLALKSIVLDYSPSADLLKRVIERPPLRASSASSVVN